MSRETLYWTLGLFLTVVFVVFYAVSYSILMGIRDNYRRYAQKERLQWTGPRQRPAPPRPALWKFLAGAVLSAWLVLDFIIFD